MRRRWVATQWTPRSVIRASSRSMEELLDAAVDGVLSGLPGAVQKLRPVEWISSGPIPFDRGRPA